MGSISEKIKRPTPANELKTKCKAKGFQPGQMEENTKGNTLMIKNKAMGYSGGQMAGDMKENGCKGNRKGRECRFLRMGRGSWRCGLRGRRL